MDNSLMMLLPFLMGQKNPDMLGMLRSMGGAAGGGDSNNIMSMLNNAMGAQNKGGDMASVIMSMMQKPPQAGATEAASEPQTPAAGFVPLSGISTDLINQLILNLFLSAKQK